MFDFKIYENISSFIVINLVKLRRVYYFDKESGNEEVCIVCKFIKSIIIWIFSSFCQFVINKFQVINYLKVLFFILGLRFLYSVKNKNIQKD